MFTPDQLTPGTRFRGNADNDMHGVCVVLPQPEQYNGSFSGPDWVFAIPESRYSGPWQKQTLIFALDEIGEIL